MKLDQGRLVVFDFDDCRYHWFVSDIATSLYFTLWEPHPDQDNLSLANFFLDHLLEGYGRQFKLDPYWVEQIPLFLKLQEMAIYMAICEYNQIAPGQLREDLPPKHQNLLARYRYNIENDIPYLESAYNPWNQG